MSDSTDDRGSGKPGVFFTDEAGAPESVNPQAYEASENIAKEAVGHMDAKRQAERCGAKVVETKRTRTVIEVPFFQAPVRITFPSGAIAGSDGRELPVWERILLLHYVTRDAPPHAHKELIGFKQVPSGGFYFDAFKRRSHDPLAKAFGSDPARLLRAGEALGGTPQDIGDAAVRVRVLPKVPVIAVIHTADDEFPAEAKILFESDVTAYFCTEDIAVIGGLVAGRLIQAASQLP